MGVKIRFCFTVCEADRDQRRVNSFKILETNYRAKGANKFGQAKYGALLVSRHLLEDVFLGPPTDRSIRVDHPILNYRLD